MNFLIGERHNKENCDNIYYYYKYTKSKNYKFNINEHYLQLSRSYRCINLRLLDFNNNIIIDKGHWYQILQFSYFLTRFMLMINNDNKRYIDKNFILKCKVDLYDNIKNNRENYFSFSNNRIDQNKKINIIKRILEELYLYLINNNIDPILYSL